MALILWNNCPQLFIRSQAEQLRQLFYTMANPPKPKYSGGSRHRLTMCRASSPDEMRNFKTDASGWCSSTTMTDRTPIPDLRIESLSFAYQSIPVICELSLCIPQGCFLTLLGPSGCGKTTLLKLLAGHLTPQSGRIVLGRRELTGLPPESRNIGMVFQDYALFPHLTARKNVAFGLEVRGIPAGEVRAKTDAMMELVGLSAAERDRRPSQLSGGQQQRVALARALAFGPQLLLLDEPLSSLDRYLRESTQAELRRVHAESGVTTVMVTHDQNEAMTMSDLIGVMQSGRLLQLGTPQEIYVRPQTLFVAGFVGSANLIDGAVLGHEPGTVALIRPEHIRSGNRWHGRIAAVTFLGPDAVCEIVCDSLRLTMRTRSHSALRAGDPISVDVAPEHVWIIPERS